MYLLPLVQQSLVYMWIDIKKGFHPPILFDSNLEFRNTLLSFVNWCIIIRVRLSISLSYYPSSMILWTPTYIMLICLMNQQMVSFDVRYSKRNPLTPERNEKLISEWVYCWDPVATKLKIVYNRRVLVYINGK